MTSVVVSDFVSMSSFRRTGDASILELPQNIGLTIPEGVAGLVDLGTIFP